MIEKSVILEGVSLVDFLGVENRNLNALISVFPKSKIISRGEEITIRGDAYEVDRIARLIHLLMLHFQRFGHITEDTIRYYNARYPLQDEPEPLREDVLLHSSQGLPIKSRTPQQHNLVAAAKRHALVFALGPAGSGKTYLSVALAVQALKKKRVRRIIITRPVVEAGERLGFLPGDLKAKIDPYLRPIYDVLKDLISAEKTSYYIDREIIEIAPLAYMRGRTLHDAFILLDEAQNTTPMQMKMALTRMGATSRMIVTGDPSQVDLPADQPSGLEHALQRLQGLENVGFVHFTERDVVRHRLVRDIIRAYRETPPSGRV